jgi:threonine dehydrogenase-like Zn-dependent dehydrogenase
VQELTGRDVSIVFECIGVRGTLNESFMHAAVRAIIVVLGACMDQDEIFPLQGVLKELTVRFALGYTKAEFAEVLAALASRRIDVGPLITDAVPVEAAPAAFDALLRPNNQGKVLIEFP